MAAVTLSREASKAPEWLQRFALVAVRYMLDLPMEATEDAIMVESIVYDAEALLVSMDVRTTPVLTNVDISFVVR